MPLRRGLELSSATLALAGTVLAAGPAAAAELLPVEDVILLGGSPLHVPLNGVDAEGRPLSFTAESSDPELVAPSVLEGNRSLRITVAGFGEMLIELFEARVPRAAGRIAELAESGFYDGITFHRVIDGFVIQGGDPTGTGSGGSTLGTFDDQYHVDIQHNRTGLISMAKNIDDSNDSQFFITEGSTRNLDYQHSIFGLVVTGDEVREAISGVATDASDRPVEPVVMETVEVVVDGQNAVLMLKAPEAGIGTAQVTVTVTDADGVIAQQTFRVDVAPDPVNSPPFLADIAPVATPLNTPVTFQLQALDVEGDVAFYLDEATMVGNGLSPPVLASANVSYSVDFNSGRVTVTPADGVSGVELISVATALSATAVDYQVVPITIGP